MKAHNMLAIIQADPAIDLPTIRQAIAKLIEETLKEETCVQFYIREDTKEPGTFYLWESWAGKEGLELHYEAAHTKEYFAKNYTQVIKIIELSDL